MHFLTNSLQVLAPSTKPILSSGTPHYYVTQKIIRNHMGVEGIDIHESSSKSFTSYLLTEHLTLLNTCCSSSSRHGFQSYFTVRTHNSIASQQKFNKGLMSANTLPPYLLSLPLLFDCQFLCGLQASTSPREGLYPSKI